MTEDTKIADLQNAWKKIEESEKAASAKTLKEGAGSESTPTSKKFSVADTHSKPATPVKRDMGAQDGKKEVGDDHGSKAAVGDANPVKRDQGSVAGNKEVGDAHGTKKGVGSDNSVPRKEGSGNSVHKYSEFRAKIKSVLGLSLTDPLNATGKGLNK
jgi:hypothetical protein